MENSSDTLMLHGVVAYCADCGRDTIFVPAEDGCEIDHCEMCCTACDAAVFLLEALENTGQSHHRVA